MNVVTGMFVYFCCSLLRPGLLREASGNEGVYKLLECHNPAPIWIKDSKYFLKLFLRQIHVEAPHRLFKGRFVDSIFWHAEYFVCNAHGILGSPDPTNYFVVQYPFYLIDVPLQRVANTRRRFHLPAGNSLSVRIHQTLQGLLGICQVLLFDPMRHRSFSQDVRAEVLSVNEKKKCFSVTNGRNVKPCSSIHHEHTSIYKIIIYIFHMHVVKIYI